jgi:flagellar M-ring protein FliF
VQNLLQIWQGLDARRRMIIGGATLAMFMAILGLSRMAAAPNMTLLYAGLTAAAAGEVVASLEQGNIQYQVRGDSIYVADTMRDSLRMTLAAQGLPATGGAGYEILEGLSGFGTTSEMFDAAYWRAKEGELARSILANPQIKAARVHIAQAPTQTFQRNVKPSASVTITSVGGNLPPTQAKALRHLVAASVQGMTPNEVAVIDSVAGLIPSEGDQAPPSAFGDTRAQELRANVERLLAARVGPNKAVVEVSVDVITDSEAISERIIDPQGRVAISTETNNSTGSQSQGGDVTVASNLPNTQGLAGAGKNESSDQRETVNYDVSETKRDIIKAPGSVRKISVAVLIDGVQTTAADGTITFSPRPDDELAILRELVASAVGLDEGRGDVLTLRSLAFAPAPATGEMVTASVFGAGSFDWISLVQTAILAAVALILGLFVIRPMLTHGPKQALLLSADQTPMALPAYGTPSPMVLTGEIDGFGDLPTVNLDSLGTDPPLDPVARLRRLIEERQAESVEILRGWMEQEEEKA